MRNAQRSRNSRHATRAHENQISEGTSAVFVGKPTGGSLGAQGDDSPLRWCTGLHQSIKADRFRRHDTIRHLRRQALARGIRTAQLQLLLTLKGCKSAIPGDIWGIEWVGGVFRALPGLSQKHGDSFV